MVDACRLTCRISAAEEILRLLWRCCRGWRLRRFFRERFLDGLITLYPLTGKFRYRRRLQVVIRVLFVVTHIDDATPRASLLLHNAIVVVIAVLIRRLEITSAAVVSLFIITILPRPLRRRRRRARLTRFRASTFLNHSLALLFGHSNLARLLLLRSCRLLPCGLLLVVCNSRRTCRRLHRGRRFVSRGRRWHIHCGRRRCHRRRRRSHSGLSPILGHLGRRRLLGEERKQAGLRHRAQCHAVPICLPGTAPASACTCAIVIDPGPRSRTEAHCIDGRDTWRHLETTNL